MLYRQSEDELFEKRLRKLTSPDSDQNTKIRKIGKW